MCAIAVPLNVDLRLEPPTTVRAQVGAVKEVLQRLAADLQGRHEEMADMMRRLDRSGDGRLDREELRGGLRNLGTPPRP